MQTLSFQAPENMNLKIAEVAHQFDRSKGYIIRQAVEAYLEEMEDLQEAKAYKSQYNPADNISFEEIKKKHKLD